MLEKKIREKLRKKEILLISHAVLGFPNSKICEQSIAEIARAAEICELQIPFSDPQADGPFFTGAQQKSIAAGTRVADCIFFAEKICQKFPETIFVFMTYFNIIFKFGVEKFVKKSAEIGVAGIILPDLPLEEAGEFLRACEKFAVAPIFLFTPNMSEKRMREISAAAAGFIYCQSRTGVTGTRTKFDDAEKKYIARCRRNTNLPLAMGFGIQKKSDVDFLKNKVDIAICCTAAVKILKKNGPQKMGEFLQNLR